MNKKSVKEHEAENISNSQKNENHENLQKQILENLVGLQKVHVNLAEKFDSLSQQLSELLKLFELAARSFSESPAVMSSEKDKEFLDKIDRLLEQNKTIAKGLTLMEERIRERAVSGIRPAQIQPTNYREKNEEELSVSSVGKPLPKF